MAWAVAATCHGRCCVPSDASAALSSRIASPCHETATATSGCIYATVRADLAVGCAHRNGCCDGLSGDEEHGCLALSFYARTGCRKRAGL